MPSKRPNLSLVVDQSSRAADADLDRLYQLPLSEFTAARNELAKRRPGADPPIKGLAKPTAAAWAVNQLYWHSRPVYDQLIDASERLRAEHRKLLAGRTAALRDAEQAHRAAVRSALEAVRTFLTRGGEAVTPATMASVTETLEALPAAEPPGRLTRPLKPMGFEALAGVTVRESGGAVRPTSAAGSAGRDAKVSAPADDVKREQARKRQAVKDAERARADVERARAALAQAERVVERARRALEEHEHKVSEARRSADRARNALSDAMRAHEHAQRLVRD